MLKKYLKGYSYNDLKLVYYKSLCEKFPDIGEINKHETIGRVKLKDVP